MAALNAFRSSLIVVTSLTLLCEFGASQLLEGRDSFLPLKVFAPSIFLLFVLAGLSTFTSLRSRMTEWLASQFLLGFAGALTGWGAGLTLSALIRTDWRAAVAGTLLTLCVIVLSLAPVFMVRRFEAFRRDAHGRLFPQRRLIIATRLMALVFLFGGMYGLFVHFSR
ncbi:hypothetical protein [Achromobacter deleyi]|uniref:hypothetical protein n=1 Tax=Achromobacter deleyi TaxID=1353891 RepID=UPI001492118C|nr:hypothetical protein [Achromobacter deleyi]QVQ27625.1 hypothetical protein HLG70_04020 [Achromobacter deleyi]UIP23223.1 hypothetical protein LYZ39_12130 [Achromobacter deleyi]